MIYFQLDLRVQIKKHLMKTHTFNCNDPESRIYEPREMESCRYLLLLMCALSLFELWIIMYSQEPISQHAYNSIWGYFQEKRLNLTNRTILIQWRTKFFSGNTDKLYGVGRRTFSGCFEKNCKMIPVTSEETADVFIFHSRDPPKLPPKRLPEHKYIFLSQEAEVYENPRPIIYNLTMTYRLDSDIPIPYIAFKKKENPRTHTNGSNFNFAGGKTKKVAWVVSNCKTQSGRERYVNELKKYIDVDIYGKCGPLNCDSQCFSMINTSYKFYLAFENSICEDYITEKLHRTMHMGGIIPVVLGGANYSKLLPPHSVINVMDYQSPRALADYLHKLDQNDTLYNEFFQWRDFYYMVYEDMWCALCKYLHANRNQTKMYGNIRQWYSAATRCRTFTWGNWWCCIRHYNDLTLHWRHNGHDGVSNHQPYDCLLNCLFRRKSKKTSKLRVTGLCEGNSPGTGEFIAQMASNAENVSIWWRHHDMSTMASQTSTKLDCLIHS